MSQAAACRHLATVRVTTEKLAKRVSCGFVSEIVISYTVKQGLIREQSPTIKEGALTMNIAVDGTQWFTLRESSFSVYFSRDIQLTT